MVYRADCLPHEYLVAKEILHTGQDWPGWHGISQSTHKTYWYQAFSYFLVPYDTFGYYWGLFDIFGPAINAGSMQNEIPDQQRPTGQHRVFLGMWKFHT